MHFCGALLNAILFEVESLFHLLPLLLLYLLQFLLLWFYFLEISYICCRNFARKLLDPVFFVLVGQERGREREREGESGKEWIWCSFSSWLQKKKTKKKKTKLQIGTKNCNKMLNAIWSSCNSEREAWGRVWSCVCLTYFWEILNMFMKSKRMKLLKKLRLLSGKSIAVSKTFTKFYNVSKWSQWNVYEYRISWKRENCWMLSLNYKFL